MDENITTKTLTTSTPTPSTTTRRQQQIILDTKTNGQIKTFQKTRPLLPISSSFSTITTTKTPTTTHTTTFKSGCLIDLLLLIDSSGSVEQAFEQEKRLAVDIIQKLRLGPQNAHVALIKFASADKVRTIQSFLAPQSQEKLLQLLNTIPFSDGITAIHSALRQVINRILPERLEFRKNQNFK